MGSDGTQRMGRHPSHKSDYAQRTEIVSHDTAREGRQCRRDRQTRPTQRKRRRARSVHSKRASARPSAKADKDSTKKERGMVRVSDSYWASNRGTYARQVSDPGKGRTLERAQNSQSLATAGGPPVNVPASTGTKRSLRQRVEAHPEGYRAKQK